MKLSVIIIAKNAENYIADALSSVKFADEIIIVDSGSTDKTVDIAKKMDTKVFSYLAKNFADARNFGLQKAKGEWVLYIDTDERATEELQKEILLVISDKKSLPADATHKALQVGGIIAYKIKRKNFYFGDYEWPYIEKLERLFKKKHLKEWFGVLHESPKIEGQVGELDGFLLHYSHQNISQMLEKTIAWSKEEATLRMQANHPKMTWWRFPRVMISSFLNSYIKQQGWKVGMVGVVESMYQAFSMFITYARLWELQREQKK